MYVREGKLIESFFVTHLANLYWIDPTVIWLQADNTKNSEDRLKENS
jgi:hypothetical protein